MTRSYISPSDVTHINVVTPSAVLSTDPSNAVSSAVPTTRRANPVTHHRFLPPKFHKIYQVMIRCRLEFHLRGSV